ncbi:MAG: site-specific integrase, partial [Faecalibacterium prausnitzii]|nr:site-specific integrase [Faecalibacterium prausnitzii]
KKLGKKFEEGFYKPGATLVQAAPVEAEPTISVSALLELLKDADPAVKAQLRLALLT